MGSKRTSGWILARFGKVLGRFGEGFGRVWGRFWEGLDSTVVIFLTYCSLAIHSSHFAGPSGQSVFDKAS